MEGATPMAAGVTSPRCLAVHRDDIGLTIERIDRVVKPIVGWEYPLVREKPPQEIQPPIPHSRIST